MIFKPKKHQLQYIDLLKKTKYLGLLAYHGMGSGKTFTALTYTREHLASVRQQGHPSPKFMVIPPKSAIITWQKESRLHTPDIYRDMLIVPFSQLSKAPQLIRYYDIRVLIVDESQFLKSPTTDRIKFMAETLKALRDSPTGFKDGKIIFLSGTPMMNHAGELFTTWAMLSSTNLTDAIRRMLDEKDYDKWLKNFCKKKTNTWTRRNGTEDSGSAYKGVDNVELLNTLLAPITHYVPIEECTDLPPCAEIDIDIGHSDDKLLADANIEDEEAYMAQLERLARAKTPYALQWVQDFIHSTNEQLVVFSTFKFPILELKEKFPKDVVLVTGDESSGERIANIDAFQKGNKKIIAMTYKAGSDSLNLQNAYKTLYCGYPWNESTINQAKARTHRTGQTKHTQHYFIYSGENDRRIRNLVNDKGAAVREVESKMLENRKKEIDLDIFI